MNAKHYFDSAAVYIHMDFDYQQHANFEAFHTQLHGLEGVDEVKYNRYSIAIYLGYMFDALKVKYYINNLFYQQFNVVCDNEITVAEIKQKAEASLINPSFNFSGIDPLEA